MNIINSAYRLLHECRIRYYSRRISRRANVGRGFRVNGKGVIYSPQLLKIGSNVHIGNNYFINASGEISIGDNTHISRNFICYSANHDYNGNALPYDKTIVCKSVTIGKNVWVAMNVSIVPGVTIGEGAIIGMGAVVVKDVQPLAIVGGNPAKVLKYRDKEHYERLDREKRYGGISGAELDFSMKD